MLYLESLIFLIILFVEWSFSKTPSGLKGLSGFIATCCRMRAFSELWYSIGANGSTMFRISRKLKLIKNNIRSFCKANYSNLEK